MHHVRASVHSVLKTTRMNMAKLLRNHGKMPFPVKDLASVTTAVESIAANRSEYFSRFDVNFVHCFVSYAGVLVVECDWSGRRSLASVHGSGAAIVRSLRRHRQ